ncbi:S-adenosyl-L-methionine dependent methyltransferase [Aspergillus costaricaensis CBS 115574]|uniref:S-adenosyl-L-methionine dependent methyltransferase n=1 Tax=Aspergillus costaricaensis CBS 115574 TaxID=1448317 RepID=A0ACD1ICY9_9EURO|nr:S-adenosyl-L-methionine dependent methyltransferase [Aspergillus costaricaensis CBS 115574]RAK87871.1 S-adenosyl-L-methionine dependent methyltransferase [Aspergillus costaricaensis CBS 115574]
MTSGSITTTTTATDDFQKHPSIPSEEVIYKPWDLLVYEIWVLGIVSTWAWGCSTSEYLLPQFRANIGKNHLDIGSGTGYYLRRSEIPVSTLLTLLDLERPALDLGLQRCGRPDARGLQADILQPLPVTDKFDSVSMYYLLHCIPATVAEKCAIFKHIKRNMTRDGVIHGASVLGKGVRNDNCFAAHVRRGVLKAGIFHNIDDNAYDFEHALRTNFEEVETRVVGSVFMFRASSPKQNEGDLLDS